jgi:UDP-N-acetylmuramoylalanine--D-glutamate ligase
MIHHQIDFEEFSHDIATELSPQLIIKSPGIPDTAAIVRQFADKNIPVISEIEFASQHCKTPIIAITGSNGKTTTTNLIAHMLETAGKKVLKAGNVGFSFARAISLDQYDVVVLEVSSFQLDGIQSFRPHISIMLNITPDHLDRYANNFSQYIFSKFRITSNQTSQDHFIFNGTDPVIEAHLQQVELPVQLHPVYAHVDERENLFDSEIKKGNVSHTNLKGKHNAINAVCAIVAAELCEVESEIIQKALETFINDPHRLEFVSWWKDIEWINDSKATNVDSVWYALDTMVKRVVWIAGGQDKGNDYTLLENLVCDKVYALIGLGVDNSKLIHFFKTKLPVIEDTHSMEEALQAASKHAQPGDVVLLSPACASFDLFKNYQDRGDQFKSIVHRWENETRELSLN